MSTPYTYLFIRKDLSGPQRIVQTAHAAHEAGERFGAHSHIALMGIADQRELIKAANYPDRCGIQYQMFYESTTSEYTAIATEPLSGDRRKHLRRYSLLKE